MPPVPFFGRHAILHGLQASKIPNQAHFGTKKPNGVRNTRVLGMSSRVWGLIFGNEETYFSPKYENTPMYREITKTVENGQKQ